MAYRRSCRRDCRAAIASSIGTEETPAMKHGLLGCYEAAAARRTKAHMGRVRKSTPSPEPLWQILVVAAACMITPGREAFKLVGDGRSPVTLPSPPRVRMEGPQPAVVAWNHRAYTATRQLLVSSPMEKQGGEGGKTGVHCHALLVVAARPGTTAELCLMASTREGNKNDGKDAVAGVFIVVRCRCRKSSSLFAEKQSSHGKGSQSTTVAGATTQILLSPLPVDHRERGFKLVGDGGRRSRSRRRREFAWEGPQPAVVAWNHRAYTAAVSCWFRHRWRSREERRGRRESIVTPARRCGLREPPPPSSAVASTREGNKNDGKDAVAGVFIVVRCRCRKSSSLFAVDRESRETERRESKNMTQLEPGPICNSVLTQQQPHRSTQVWKGSRQINKSLKCCRYDRSFWNAKKEFDDRVMAYIQLAGFDGLSRLERIHLDWSLITAMVERWRPETHCFQLPFGEVTITLQDVEVLLGLRIDGMAMTSGQTRTKNEWCDICHDLLGIS
nr:serine/threonine-protein phosphatase 7 long form homolog [Ipomoea batatas]